MKALYTICNINLDTVETVAEHIRNTIENGFQFDKLFLISSDSSHKFLHEQQEIYFRILGDMRFEEVIIDITKYENQNRLTEIFKESDKRFIDLTNGQKPLASMLYMAASLCGIEDIYYLMKNGDTSLYVKLNHFCKANELTTVAFYDLIYYNEEIKKIFQPDTLDYNSQLHKAFRELQSSVSEFFIRHDYKNAIISATCCNEYIINRFLDYIQNDERVKAFAKTRKIDLLDKSKDPVGIITYLFRQYLNVEEKEKEEKIVSDVSFLNKIHYVPPLLSLLRGFRNVAAHYSMHNHSLTSTEARLAIISSIELYRNLRYNNEIWNLLNSNEKE